jgi:dihydroorotase
MDLLLKNCTIINHDRQSHGHVIIDQGFIQDVLLNDEIKNIEAEARKVIDCNKYLVMPALIDMHAHFRDPGFEYKEDIITGSQAAVAGGYTTCLSMGNTNPPADNSTVIKYMIEKSNNCGLIDLLPYGCITQNRSGEHLVEMGDMLEVGAVAFSDDGNSVMNSDVMRRALEYAATFNTFIATHAEDIYLADSGQINEGIVSAITGLKGIPAAAEASIIARDLLLAQLTNSHLHICHVSSQQSVDLIRWGKNQGIYVTAEVTPHHLSFTEDNLLNYNSLFKVNPPFRTNKDIDALFAGLKDGTIDVISTDHAPHSIDEKHIEFENAAFGMIGLQSTIPLMLQMVENGKINICDMAKLTSYKPSKILNLKKGKIEKNFIADIVIIDKDKEYTYDKTIIKSKNFNTPLYGVKLKGIVIYTIKSGTVVYTLH